MHGVKKEVRFGKRAEKYDAGIEGKFLKKFYDSMERFVKVDENETMLDVGCGTGAILDLFKDNGIKGYGIDVDPKMLSVAAKKLPQMEFIEGSCDSMPFKENMFDVITVCMAYHHFENKGGFARECARILKDNGSLYIAELWLPKYIRKMVMFFIRLFHVSGTMYSMDDLINDFEKYGFTYEKGLRKGMVQMIQIKNGI